MRENLLQGFWLGELWIAPLTGTVTAKDRDAHLPSRAIEVLLCLAQQPGEIVSRQQLLAEVWGDETTSGEALSHAISELRAGLGDHAESPEFIQTVPRRGYRLLQEPRLETDTDTTLTPVLELPLWQELLKRGVVQAAAVYLVAGWLLIQVAGETFDNLGFPPWAGPFVTYVVVGGFPLLILLAWFLEFHDGRMTIDRDAAAPRKKSGLMRNYLAVLAAYVIATAGVGAYQFTVGIAVPGTPVAKVNAEQPALVVAPNSVAVLRFLNIGGDERARIFSDGLAEDVLDRLARVPGLSVSSRTDAWSLPAETSSADVRRRLRVANYLEGSVRLDDDQLRVTVQLIDSESGFHKFSRTFTRELVKFMQVQKEITDLTVANMRIAFEAEADTWLMGSEAGPDIDAYVLYRRGREIFDMPLTMPLLERAVHYFEESLALDPHYAAAHAGSCAAYVEMYLTTSEPERITAAEKSCASALLANPNLFMVFTALGDLYRHTNRLELAELAYRNALDRNAKDVDAMTGLARVFADQNRLDEAEFQHKRAMLLQPGNWRLINALGTFYFATGKFAEAASAFRQVVFLDPDNWQTQGNLGSALLMTGNFEQAEDALTEALAINPTEGSYSNLGIVHYYMGEFNDAAAAHRRALELTPRSNIAWLNLADALYFAKDEAAAMAAFEKAAELSEERLAVNAGELESIETLAFARAMLGEGEKAAALIRRAIALAPNNPYTHYYDALIRHRAGDLDGALDAIDAAINAGYAKTMLKAEPYLADLQKQGRFMAMLAPDEKH